MAGLTPSIDAPPDPQHQSPPEPVLDPEGVIDQLIAAGGTLRVPDPLPSIRSSWRRAIRAIYDRNLCPTGQRVRYSGRSGGELVIRLEPVPTPCAAPAMVRVPNRLVGLHPLLLATQVNISGERGPWIDTRRRSGSAHLRVTRKKVTRAMRLLHALVVEAARRGYGIDVAKEHRCVGGLAVVIEDHPIELVIVETTRRVPVSTEGNSRWAPKWDTVPTGRLRLQVGHSYEHCQLAIDGVRVQLESRLGHVMARLERHADEAAASARASAQAAAARQRAQEEAIARAGRELLARTRATHLAGQVSAWRLAADIRTIVAATRQAEPGDADVQAWLAWALSYADDIDPLRQGLRPPTPPRLTLANSSRSSGQQDVARST